MTLVSISSGLHDPLVPVRPINARAILTVRLIANSNHVYSGPMLRQVTGYGEYF